MKKSSKLAIFRQYAAATVASISVIILGAALGWPSPVLKAMEETGEPFVMTNSEVSWMVSLLYLGNLMSPIPAGYLMDLLGRKNALLVMALVPLSSWACILYAKNAMTLYIARFLAGLWSGIVSTVTPMYLAEISEPKIRGALSTFVQMMTNMGVLMEYISGPLVSYSVLAMGSGCLPLIFMIFFSYMPESPYWLIMKGKKTKAMKSLAWLRGASDTGAVKEELEILETAVNEEMKNKRTFRDLFATKGNRKALLIVEMLAFLQRTSGISALMAYTSTTLPERGVGRLSPNDCVIVMGMVWCTTIFIATVLVDKLGRRPLLLASCTGAGISMLTAGTWFYLDEKTNYDVSDYDWIPFASFLGYAVFFSIGLGPIASTVQGEAFPSNIKGLASGITSIVLAVTSFVMNKIYHTIADSIGMFLNFWIFGSSCVFAIFFVVFFVIETKGKTLHEIQEILNGSKKKAGKESETNPI